MSLIKIPSFRPISFNPWLLMLQCLGSTSLSFELRYCALIWTYVSFFLLIIFWFFSIANHSSNFLANSLLIFFLHTSLTTTSCVKQYKNYIPSLFAIFFYTPCIEWVPSCMCLKKSSNHNSMSHTFQNQWMNLVFTMLLFVELQWQIAKFKF